MDALEKEAFSLGISANTLLAQFIAEKYKLSFSLKGTRAPGVFKKGELNKIILSLLDDLEPGDHLTTLEITDTILSQKTIPSDKIESAKKSISSVLCGMSARKKIKLAGTVGRTNAWSKL